MKIYPFKAAVGFLILYFSVILLLTTTDIVPWNIWLFVWQFWPMLFVVSGIAFLMRRWKADFLVGIPVFLIIFGMMGFGLWTTWKDKYFQTDNFVEENVKGITQTTLSNEIPKNTEKADVRIRLGAGDIKVGPITEKTDVLMYEGKYSSNFFTLSQRIDNIGEKTKVLFSSSPFIKKPFSSKSVNELNLKFSEKLEYALEVESGASDIDLDLEKLKVTDLDLDAGASNISVKLPSQGSVDISVKSGASSLKFYIPKSSGVKISAKSALSSNNFEAFGLIKNPKSWESKNWEDAKNKINIDLDSGISKIELIEY